VNKESTFPNTHNNTHSHTQREKRECEEDGEEVCLVGLVGRLFLFKQTGNNKQINRQTNKQINNEEGEKI